MRFRPETSGFKEDIYGPRQTKKWAEISILESFNLSKKGIEIKIWDKYGRKPMGHAKISIGGIHWRPHGKHKHTQLIKWSELGKVGK